MNGPIPRTETGYNFGEGRALLAPLLGMDPAGIRGFLVIGVDRQGGVTLGGSPGISDHIALVILEGMAAGMRARGIR